MKKFNIKKGLNIPPLVFFVLAILLILKFAPHESEFNYSFVENKPWRYGLLQATFDFPISKSDDQIKKERDSVTAAFQPYYQYNQSIAPASIKHFQEDAHTHEIPDEYVNYVVKKLKEIYKTGIISIEEYDRITDTNGQKHFKLRDENENIAKVQSLTDIYTSKQAYQKILKDMPAVMNPFELRSLDFNNYLSGNIIYDAEMSQKVMEDALQQISLVQGMVQSGQKIIDRGEIVDSRTYSILKSLEKASGERSLSESSQLWLTIGQVIMVSIFMFSFMLYLYFFRPREYANKKNLIFMLLTITTFCVLTGIAADYKSVSVYVIPFAIPTILIRTFIDSRTAMMSHIVTILICSLMVDFPVEFILLQFPIGFICIFGLKDLSERSQLIRCSFLILLGYIIVYVGFVLWQDRDIQVLLKNGKMFIYFGINFIFVMFSYLLVYMCEKVFGFISGVSMVELSNINKPLLLKLSETAPGTFQHSMQVANLAAAAAVKIGANASLARTGALYHDVGKMKNPEYFTENQSPGQSPHKNLSYLESARIIIGHVEEGEKIAKSYNLPQQIIDFILTHHGKGKARFFYNSYKNEHPDEEIDESAFTYPGPNPFSKETAILMMADTVEAASRSLPEYSEESISSLVNKLIDFQLQEGLLKNTPLTFKDIEKIKGVFIEKLITIYHTRISYPELNK
ncbi:HD family phosphohydrolase [Dysgonomonas sp. 520]|uniref:HD family phosphohydrolase n=1 Tax=Dysgonomonas sp. 520 TaxID=2302931 RepID=UPI0013D0DF80|nr:HDIG domain-containing metalloprotein [Dysgonomonas sp. 520]NDW08223.1 HDIG domain-containing protein [Dysgonomonas sp. 520]